MRVFSFARLELDLTPIEVEVGLAPGLPVLRFLGLPDAAIRESVMRIKSAIRRQGFNLPRTQQILINLRPGHFKKHSHGLDLAVAAAILWKTQQIPPPENEQPHLYGELSLSGEVTTPSDAHELNCHGLYTGPMENPLCSVLSLNSLRDLSSPLCPAPVSQQINTQRPQLPDLKISPQLAQIMKIIVVGEHSCLFAGPSGTGKTTVSKLVHALLRPPSELSLRTSGKIWRDGKIPAWRPVVSPHHSATTKSLVGGGTPPTYGEISRAHGGVLILDELLEFHHDVLQALRQPIESGQMTIARAGRRQTLPARFILIGNTNLCPCGALMPGCAKTCGYTRQRCQKSLHKLVGPLLDRFATVALVEPQTNKIPVRELQNPVDQAVAFAKESRGQEIPNAQLSLQELESQWPAFCRKFMLFPQQSSQRRTLSLLRVARTLADLDLSHEIQIHHLEESAQWTIKPHEDLRLAMD